MLNMPDSLGVPARIWTFLPVTFLGSWTLTDYHLVWLLGKPLTVIQAAPLVYLLLALVMAAITKLSYDRYQVQGQ